jgi:hypothetical protein
MAFSPPFTPLQSLPGERTGQLRLASIGGGIALYRGVTEAAAKGGYQTVLQPTVITGNPPFAVKIVQPLGTPPAYDVVPTPEGALRVAIEMLGGAPNALLVSLEVEHGPAATLLYQDFHDYTCPRFVRGNGVAPGEALATAVVGRSVFVGMTEKPVDPSKLTPQSAPFKALTDAADGRIASAVAISDGAPPLVPRSGGSASPLSEGPFPPVAALFTLALITGVSPAPSGDAPGKLSVKAAGKTQPLWPIHPVPDNAAFAFDVDTQLGASLVLVSTRTGPQLLGYNAVSHAVTPIDWPTGYLPSDLSWIASPTVLGVPPERPGAKPFSFAFYAGTGEGADRRVTGIRYGQVDLATLP